MQPCCIFNHTFVCGVCVVASRFIVAHNIFNVMGVPLVFLPRCLSLYSPVICGSVGVLRLFSIVGYGLGVVCRCCIAAALFSFRRCRRIRTRGLALIMPGVGVVVELVSC